MKLFNNLSEEEQHNAIEYCINDVLNDIINDERELEFAPENQKIKEKFEASLKHIEKMEDFGEQCEYLMNDKEIGQMIFDISADLARDTFYAAHGENVIYECELHEHEDDEEENEELPELDKTKKTSNNLN